MSDNLTSRKIHPRNLTARADRWVRGNPVTTRPESGVDNCYPGLEFDQRNLEKRFLPGLEFEFHLGGVPPLLRAVDDGRAGRALPFRPTDFGGNPADALFLWAVFGTFGAAAGPVGRVERFGGQASGLWAWRALHDLEPGPVAVLLAHMTEEGGIDLEPATNLTAEAALLDGNDVAGRDEEERLTFAVIAGTRCDYLVDGVINPAIYAAGDLTRSLCAPWQYDFTDCGCFYWASNKPDLVAVDEGAPQIYNFQRMRRGEGEERPVAEVLADRAGLLTIRGWDDRDPDSSNRILNHRELINDWQRLSPVFEATEARAFTPHAPTELPPGRILSRAEVLKRLRYLATVEHGLMVEYLYAYYSVAAPRIAPDAAGAARRNYDVARSVLSVAIDEMRHFRWVNEMLRELGQPLELGRVEEFQDLDGDGRFIPHSFGLKALSAARLDWFIEVEKPSARVDPALGQDTIDGLYTRLMLSIRQSGEFTDDERARLTHLVKLIIDEGLDHFTRFSSVKATLAGAPGDWLRPGFADAPLPLPDGHPAKAAEIVADRAYGTVLTTLGFVFSASNRRTGDLLQAARFAMYALDDAAHEAIAQGGAPLFTTPAPGAVVAAAGARGAAATPAAMLEQAIVAPMQAALADLRARGGAATVASMQRHYDRLVAEMAPLLQ